MLRALKYLSLVGAALAVGLLAVAYFSLNALVKRAVETLGPEITKTEVRLDRVSLLPFAGSGSLHGLSIGNPKGCKAETAFRVGKIRVSLEPKSLLSSVAVIKRIEVIDPEINYEGTLAESNLSRLQRNVESFSGPSKKAARPPVPAKKIIIDDFLVRGGKVTVDLKFLVQAKPLVVDLPELHLKGIGRKTGGATIKEAAQEIFVPLTRSITQAVAQPIADLTKNAGSIGKSLQSALGGLFGKKK
ncbi:MAG: hypothetical protein HY077_15020 [Elusimicrobia bacterium]|nr:hypothetical protein [Elusimicrobiota bacterium]